MHHPEIKRCALTDTKLGLAPVGLLPPNGVLLFASGFSGLSPPIQKPAPGRLGAGFGAAGRGADYLTRSFTLSKSPASKMVQVVPTGAARAGSGWPAARTS